MHQRGKSDVLDLAILNQHVAESGMGNEPAVTRRHRRFRRTDVGARYLGTLTLGVKVP